MGKVRNKFKSYEIDQTSFAYDSPICFGKVSARPLKAYDSESMAKKAALYVENKYGNKQVPYKCKVCNY